MCNVLCCSTAGHSLQSVAERGGAGAWLPSMRQTLVPALGQAWSQSWGIVGYNIVNHPKCCSDAWQHNSSNPEAPLACCGLQVAPLVAKYAGRPELEEQVTISTLVQQNNAASLKFGIGSARLLEQVRWALCCAACFGVHRRCCGCNRWQS